MKAHDHAQFHRMGRDGGVFDLVLLPAARDDAANPGGSGLLWMVYGFLIGAAPVVVANVIVAAAAIYSSLRTLRPLLEKEASADNKL